MLADEGTITGASALNYLRDPTAECGERSQTELAGELLGGGTHVRVTAGA